jgi:hypothetical protein
MDARKLEVTPPGKERKPPRPGVNSYPKRKRKRKSAQKS